MRYHEITELYEARMNPNALKRFLNSPAANGIRAGFEAELIFPDMITPDGISLMDDERTSNYTIDEIADYFNSPKLRNDLENSYDDYCYTHLNDEFNDGDTVGHIMNYLIDDGWNDTDAIATEITRNGHDIDEVAAIIDDGEGNDEYDSAKQDAMRNYAVDIRNAWRNITLRNMLADAKDHFEETSGYEKPTEDEFFEAFGYNTLQDIYDDQNFDYLDDPSAPEEGFNLDTAIHIGERLRHALGVQVEAVDSVGDGDRSKWIIEPDSSIEPNGSADMPCEIITPSPPGELRDTIELMDTFFAWAESLDAYANNSCGFHMSLSLPDHANRDIDYIKLVLFLGDKYVLDEFNRASNRYCESALNRITQIAKRKQPEISEQMLNMMHGSLSELAYRCVEHQSRSKYETVNMKEDYIEFRSAGSTGYFRDIPKIQNTMLRYAQALSIAGDPQAEQQEYQKKLYKLLTSGTSAKDKKSQMLALIFSMHSAGNRTDIKQQWARLNAEVSADSPHTKKTELANRILNPTDADVPNKKYNIVHPNGEIVKKLVNVSFHQAEYELKKMNDLVGGQNPCYLEEVK